MFRTIKKFPKSPIPWIIERLDRKLISSGLISNRRLVGSCFKMALNGSWKLVTKRWRKCFAQSSRNVRFVCLHVDLFRSFKCYFNFWCMFFPSFVVLYGDGDPSKPHLNLRRKHFLLLFCVICPCF